MRKTSSIGIVGAALAAALGLAEFACDTSTGTGASPGSPDAGAANGEANGNGLQATGGTDAGADGRSSLGDGVFLPCVDPSPVVIAGKDTGFVQCADGVRHRVTATSCPNALPRATGDACTSSFGIDAGAGGCSRDADCTAKPFGTCALGSGHFPSCACAYGCVADSDCATGEICECGDPVGRCLAATCHVDGSCAPGALCATVATGWGGCSWDPLVPSYICQATADVCLTDKQCTTPALPACAYDADAGARSCHEGQLACPGRPFLVEGAVRVAQTAARADWSLSSIEPCVLGLDRSTRRALADSWTRVAQMEHASVAAFARFTLELLALGAPADLVVGAQNAMADETTHAKLSFTLASAYAAEAVGPGPLPMDGAFASVSMKTTFATLVREGCIGETLAAVEASEALARATDGAVRDVLRQIARDETRHAELSWRAARWLVAQGDEELRTWARAEVARAVAEAQATVSASRAGDVATHGDLAAHGVLDAGARNALAAETLRTLVEPCARSLFTPSAPQPPAVTRSPVDGCLSPA